MNGRKPVPACAVPSSDVPSSRKYVPLGPGDSRYEPHVGQPDEWRGPGYLRNDLICLNVDCGHAGRQMPAAWSSDGASTAPACSRRLRAGRVGRPPTDSGQRKTRQEDEQ